ncbi:MAG: hypothetical protein GY904_13325 [Planctomycetaceae bacterium]|nr:hypothetical protein [Planctomycetaceae bacterium]
MRGNLGCEVIGLRVGGNTTGAAEFDGLDGDGGRVRYESGLGVCDVAST